MTGEGQRVCGDRSRRPHLCFARSTGCCRLCSPSVVSHEVREERAEGRTRGEEDHRFLHSTDRLVLEEPSA